MARLRHASDKPKIRERHKKVGVTLKTTQPKWDKGNPLPKKTEAPDPIKWPEPEP